MKLNKDNLIGVIIGFIVLVIFAICLSSGCAKRITPVPEIRYVPVTDSTAVNELVLTKELLRRTQDSLNAYKSDTTISADYFVAKYKLERIRYYNDIAGKGNNIKYKIFQIKYLNYPFLNCLLCFLPLSPYIFHSFLL